MLYFKSQLKKYIFNIHSINKSLFYNTFLDTHREFYETSLRKVENTYKHRTHHLNLLFDKTDLRNSLEGDDSNVVIEKGLI